MPYQHIPSSRPVPLNRPCLHPERNPQDESADSRQPTHLTVKKKNPRVCYLESYIHWLTGILFSPPSPSSPRFFPPQTTNLPLPLPRQNISRARGNIIRTIAAPPSGCWLDDWILFASSSYSYSSSPPSSSSCTRSFRFLFPDLALSRRGCEREGLPYSLGLLRSWSHSLEVLRSRETRYTCICVYMYIYIHTIE